MAKLGGVLRILGIGLTLVGACVAYTVYDHRHMETVAGTPSGAFVVGTTLVLHDAVDGGDSNDDRFTALDLATGARLGVRVFDDRTACYAATPGRVWCSIDSRLALVALPAFEPIAYADDLVAGAKLAKPVPSAWKLAAPDALLLLIDGRGAHIDAATLAVTGASGDGISGEPGAADGCPHTSTRELPRGASALFSDGARKRLLRREAVPIAESSAPPPAIEPPIYVGEPQFVVTPPDAPALVLHPATLDPAAELLLSRVDVSGPPRELWTASLGSGPCESVTIGAELVTITVGGGPIRALAVARETGATRWKLEP